MGEGGAGPIVTTSPEARHKRPCLERRQSFHEPFAKETSMKTLSMKVENIGFLIDHMGRGCGADQYIRELTQNAIEAVVRTGRTDGRIVWDYVNVPVGDRVVRKLCICDNGGGMSADELVRYINSLSSSGSEQGADLNYGVGAKISAATRSPEGLVYMSWQNGVGSQIQLIREDGQYGLLQFDDYRYSSEALREQLPANGVIGDSGTCVILLGESLDEDTAAPTGKTAQWVRNYLNRRYFTVPQFMELKCRSVGKTDEGRRPVAGQKFALDAAGERRGRVALTNATAYWWILAGRSEKLAHPVRADESSKPIGDMETLGTGYDVAGHTAILWKNELYDRQGHNGGHRLQQFGVLLGMRQVVIYIEPHAGSITTDIARSHVIVNHAEPPWLEWADEFKANMPAILREFIDSVVPPANDKKAGESLREMISQHMDLFQMPRFKQAKAGPDHVDADGAADHLHSKGGSGHGHNVRPPRPNRVRPLFQLPRTNGLPARQVSALDIPECRWIPVAEDTELEDMAARYVDDKAKPVILINQDFRLFCSIVDTYVKQYAGAGAGVRAHVTVVVRKWVEATLTEVVLGAKALQSQYWPVEKIVDQLQDPRTLTLAMMPRILIHREVKRAVYAELGRPGTLSEGEAAQ